jgi:hypothetical protein
MEQANRGTQELVFLIKKDTHELQDFRKNRMGNC